MKRLSFVLHKADAQRLEEHVKYGHSFHLALLANNGKVMSYLHPTLLRSEGRVDQLDPSPSEGQDFRGREA